MTRLALLTLTALLSGCFVPIHRTHLTPLPVALESLSRDSLVSDTLRVTRRDGREVWYPGPTLIGADGVAGRGRVRGQRAPSWSTPRDSIVRIVVERREIRPLPTMLATAAVSVATSTAIIAAFLSIWN